MVHDLAGGAPFRKGLFLDELDLLADGVNYRSDQSANGGRRERPVCSRRRRPRVLVRSDSYFGRPGCSSIPLPG